MSFSFAIGFSESEELDNASRLYLVVTLEVVYYISVLLLVVLKQSKLVSNHEFIR